MILILIFSVDSALRRNFEEWFRGFKYQAHMNANSLWEKLGRRRFRDKKDKKPIKGAVKRDMGLGRERLECCKYLFWYNFDLIRGIPHVVKYEGK